MKLKKEGENNDDDEVENVIMHNPPTSWLDDREAQNNGMDEVFKMKKHFEIEDILSLIEIMSYAFSFLCKKFALLQCKCALKRVKRSILLQF